MIKKGVDWRWNLEQQVVFETLKSRLTSALILRRLDMRKPFLLRTDVSTFAISAALLRGEGANEIPVEYSSRLLTSAEHIYSSMVRKALTVIWAVS